MTDSYLDLIKKLYEEITMLKVTLFIILGLFSILLMGTHVRINEYENDMKELKNQISIMEEVNEI